MSQHIVIFVSLMALSSLLTIVHGFAPTSTKSTSTTTAFIAHGERYSSSCLYAAGDGDAEKKKPSLFESEAWKPIQADLDRVPVFTVATKEGNPLAYTIEITGKGEFNVPCFYCDVDAALSELKGARENSDLEDLDIIPFPLGRAFQLWSNDEAVIVPSKQSIQQAGAPPGTNPIGQQVPLFACMEIAEEQDDGTPRLPVFLRLEDANAALKEAVEADGGSEDDFEVACLSLSGVVAQLATIPESPAFHFIPPSTSMKYIQEYLS